MHSCILWQNHLVLNGIQIFSTLPFALQVLQVILCLDSPLISMCNYTGLHMHGGELISSHWNASTVCKLCRNKELNYNHLSALHLLVLEYDKF